MAIAEQELFSQEAQPLPGSSDRLNERRILREKRMAERERQAQGATYGWRQLEPEYGEREVWE